jgi:hypothetical protein
MSRPIDIIESKYKPKMFRLLWEDTEGNVSISNNWYNKTRAREILETYAESMEQTTKGNT